MYLYWDWFPLKPSIKVKTSCPPSKSGRGKVKTAKLIDIKAANNKIPVPPCCESWAPISTIFTGPLTQLLKRICN